VLADAETALADPDTPTEDRDRWAWAHQQAYRDLARNPSWRDEVRPQVPAELRPAFDLTLRAADELHALTTPRPELPAAWRVVAPPPLDELRGHYEEAEAATGAPWHVLAAIHLVETRFGRIQGDSHAGAQGPMQFMPPTWEAYGEGDVTDPRDAILAAGRYLAASGAPGDLRAALFAYNRSERYVEAVLAYAEAIERFDHYLDVYHRWRVYYRTVDGDVVLEEGYGG
jgi:soluble lytic murein transglycosylase-like protein